MHASQDNNSTSPKRKRHSKCRPVQVTAPQPSPSHLNGNPVMDHPQQSGTSQAELVAQIQSLFEMLRQYTGWERRQLRTGVPPANDDAASDAEDGIHERIDHIESDLEKVKEMSSRSNLGETDQKVDRIEIEVDKIKKELAGLSTVRQTLASLQEQLQRLVNEFMFPGQLPSQLPLQLPPQPPPQFPGQMYASPYQPPPGV